MHNFELANQNLGFSDSSEEEIMGGPKVLLKNQILGLALPSFLKHLASPYALWTLTASVTTQGGSA